MSANTKLGAPTYIFGALGGLLFGYDLGVVAGALLLITKQFQLSALEQGFVTSSLLVGCMIGALGSARLADRLGRRKLVVGAGALFGVGCLIAALAGSLTVIVAGRLVMGLAVGALSMTVPIYLSEIAPARVRGALSGLNQLMISTGILVAYLINLGLDGQGQWRYAFGLAVVPAVALIIGVYFQPESPRWLMRQGRESEARAVLARIVPPAEVDGELAQVRAVLDGPTRPSIGALLGDRRLRRVLLVGVGVAFLQQIIGINTIIYYAPTILKALGFANSAALLANAGLGALTVVVTVIMLLLVDRIGRRRPLIIGAISMAVAMAALGTVFSVAGLKGGGAVGWLAIACLALFKISFSLSWGGMAWILLGEIFPLNVRGTAMSLATFANWAGNLFVGLFFPVLLGIGTGLVFYLFAIVGVLACGFAIRFVPETKGRSLEQIEQQLVPAETIQAV
ncbi:MAG TPA: sugar porter family MFS transporter [Pseudonocardiaceae bacterium]|jgi:sugar porter (SP) family MFS transporter|nr:sugar porter family MFS transporter [Pseudonocardiaceae bacterium]